MRIAIDLTSLADNFSGIERYAMSITQELIDLDSEQKHTYILLFKNKVHEDFRRYADKKNVVCKVYKGQNKLVFQQIILPFHLYGIKADRYLFLAFQSPVLFWKRGIYNTIHDLTSWDCPETMKKKMELYFKLTIRSALLVSEGIIVNSKFTRDRIMDKFRYNKNKITLAYCGISDVFMDYVADQPQAAAQGEEKKEETIDRLEKIRNRSLDIRRKYHLPEQYLLCLATLEPRKNLPFLVEAYVELLEEGSVDIPLVLAGRKGWKMDEFLDRIEEDYRRNIVVTGFIDDEDLPYVYHMADCFIFPSIYEGFGMPPLEAMTVGTMVISSDAASLPEVLGMAASYFRSGDKEELKEKMRQGIHQECDAVTIKEIKKRVEMFQWRRSAEKVYRRMRL
ncbi:glycosyltransferase family 4 protein [Kineothrix sp. MB12-C1]|uniref:glycosyltransferase family 4 protein n=1 Tax=Kineothrix sp. MB12-C1 TaxID=3070215 RepID=UPI0027D2B0F2|nr:glycosyltransferase family 1 protein [Kineothrix sp. MB12-C1]WMC91696.1 glycosyltransferase family 1 protein [Kineothrix sp. MB12-C1]